MVPLISHLCVFVQVYLLANVLCVDGTTLTAAIDSSNRDLKNSTITYLPNHVCSSEESYVDQVRKSTMLPVRVRSTKWCLEFPPRCSNYKIENREVIKIENVTRTRTITYCCEGYAGITYYNETECKPICRGGCGRGYCKSPNLCACEPGYSGRHCTTRCGHDRWGEDCLNVCKCENNSVCDSISGICHCMSGWTGAMCELPCPSGTFGVMCKRSCNCTSKQCEPTTGKCQGNTDNVKTSNEIPSDANPSEMYKNATTTIIESLNSTIANITQNLDIIAKNLGNSESVTFYVPETVLEITTPKSLKDLILLKPEYNNSKAIIVHQPTLIEQGKTAVHKSPEVIHVITNWQQQLKGTDDNSTNSLPSPNQESTAVTSVLILLLVLLVIATVAFFVIYRRNSMQKSEQTSNSSSDPEPGPNGNIFVKPLPDLPAFTQILRNKIEGPDFYDSPSNNSAVKSPPYSYARKESLYSVSTKSRKGSLDSHLYDEIRYPHVHQKLSNNLV